MKHFLIVAICAVSCQNLKAQFFSKVTTGPLVNTPGDSRSVNWIDVNNDGWVDCFISNGPAGGQNNTLYVNDTLGGFVAVIADPIVSDNKPSDGASFADIDNDGDMDAYVVNWYDVNKMLYLNNGTGTFTKIDTGKIVNDGGYSETASWADYDNDGYLDVYVTNSDGNYKNFMYHNNGSNNFSKIVVGNCVNDAYASRSVNWTDIDNDGDLDIFVSNEANQNENLYRDDGAGVFTKITGGPLLSNARNTMSSSWADYDNDGDLDVFLANNQSFNALFKNNGALSFVKNTTDTVVKSSSRSFSSAWSDVDNDGDQDLFVTNSFGTTTKLLNFFYLNNGNGTFSRNSLDIIANDSAWSYGCAFGDYDNDGFEDLAVATCRFGTTDYSDFLYHNNANSNKWLTVKLTGTTSNKSAIGTKIRVKAIINGVAVWQMREISAQTSYCGQNDMRAHFGLASATIIDSIKIEWPSGLIEYYLNVNSNQFVEYVEGTSSHNAIKENKADILDLLVYPNPGNGLITVALSSSNFEKEDVIVITDVSGKSIATINTGNKKDVKIDLQKYNLNKGVYFVNYSNDKKKIVKRIVLE